jgi:predicted transposase YdaD
MATPHDQFFKLAFGDPSRATELLALALVRPQSAVPPFAPLRVSKESFVPPNLSGLYSDLLFETSLGDTQVLVYILYEHKSSPDHFTIFQLYRYMGEIWARFVDNKALLLPRIVPIVVYHGTTEWTKPLSFREYFAPSPDYAAIGPELRPLFVDLARIPTERIVRLSLETRAAVGALRAAFSHKREDRELALELIRNVEVVSDLVLGLITYLYDTSPEEAEGDILKAITQPRNRELFMTIADKYRNEGRTEGRNEGHAEGVLNDRREMLVRQLSKKFGLTDEERRLIEHCDDLDRLAAAIDRFVDADSKKVVLSELRR